MLFPILTELLSRSVFTMPSALFALFGVVVVVGIRAEEGIEPYATAQARFAVLGFALICVGFYFACNRINLTSGRAFLFGFVPAWPLIRAACSGFHRHEARGRTAALALCAFAVYFWSSVLLYFWRAGWP